MNKFKLSLDEINEMLSGKLFPLHFPNQLTFKIEDKVRLFNHARKAFMQTVYIVCKPIQRNGKVWYPLATNYRTGLIHRTGNLLEAVS